MYILPAGKDDMRTELLTDTDALRRLRGPWHTLHTEASGTIFQTYDWLWSWWTVYGSRFGLRVLALWQDGELAGPAAGLSGRAGPRVRIMGQLVSRRRWSPSAA